jgi:cell wall-associated NlpC family hydrolase
MRLFLPLTTAAIFFSIILFSCKHSRHATKIKANVIKDSSISIIDSNIILLDADTVKTVDSLRQEFALKLNVPYDSIGDLKLYQFVKDNLGKKCFGIKAPEYTCESFIATLIKKVYDIDFPNSIEEQMKYKNVELFKNNNFLEQGDILFFNYSDKQKERISHAGFYLQNGYFVLATYNEGVVITKLQNGFWNKRFIAAGRYTKFTAQKKK